MYPGSKRLLLPLGPGDTCRKVEMDLNTLDHNLQLCSDGDEDHSCWEVFFESDAASIDMLRA